MELLLRNKKVLVTGSSKGIGYAIARNFLLEGARVMINARDKESLQGSYNTLSQEFGTEKVFCFPGDLTNEREVKEAVAFTRRELGGIDIAVSNIGSGKSMGDPQEREEYERMRKINYESAVYLADYVVPEMQHRGGGCIVFISSIAGIEDIGAARGYHDAKRAVIDFTKKLSREVATKNIRVNTVAPGNVKFPGGRWEELVKENPEITKTIMENVPMQRFGSPEEIASVVVFLASDKASFVTGACWVVDGGQTKHII